MGLVSFEKTPLKLQMLEPEKYLPKTKRDRKRRAGWKNEKGLGEKEWKAVRLSWDSLHGLSSRNQGAGHAASGWTFKMSKPATTEGPTRS